MPKGLLPSSLAKLTNHRVWTPITIGRSEASTYLLRSDSNNQYLKIQPQTAVESLRQEKERLEWLQGKLPVPEIMYYAEDGVNEYLLLSEIPGWNAADNRCATMLPKLMQQLAIGLLTIHEVSLEHCPFNQTLDEKLKEAKKRVDLGLVDEEDFDLIRQGAKAADLFEELQLKKPAAEDLVFAHGDYCLPNIILNEGGISGFIDWGRAGIADRYQDLALAVRSIVYNFGQEQVKRFLDEYGIKQLDEDRVYYYQLLDEFC